MSHDVAVSMSIQGIESVEVEGKAPVEPQKSGISKPFDGDAAEMRDSREHFNMRRRHEEGQCGVTSTFTVAKSAQNVRRLEVVGIGQSLEEAVECFVGSDRDPARQRPVRPECRCHGHRGSGHAAQRRSCPAPTREQSRSHRFRMPY